MDDLLKKEDVNKVNKIYTPEDLAQLLQISKHTVYELIKRHELIAFKVGNKMRIEEKYLESYKQIHSTMPQRTSSGDSYPSTTNKAIRLHGSHDILLEKICQNTNQNIHIPLQLQPSFMGSLEGCMSLYRDECDVAAVHLYDQERQQYNLPIIEQLFPGNNITVVHLTNRRQGFITQKGNPKDIFDWHDLTRNDVKFVNRQPGSGTRQLTDNRLKLADLLSGDIDGYNHIESTHYSAASQIISNQADVTVGIEPISNLLGLSFQPITNESYDLILKWTDRNKAELSLFMKVLKSKEVKNTAQNISGYDLNNIGNVIYDARTDSFKGEER